MPRIMVDNFGDAFPHDSLALSDRLAVVPRDCDLADYAVRNLGYADLLIRERRLTIKVRPTVLSSSALAGIAEVCRSVTPTRVGLLTPGDPRPSQLFASPSLALDRLTTLCCAESTDPSWSNFTAHPITLDDIDGPSYGPMQVLVLEWSLLGHRLDDDILRRLTRQPSPTNVAILARTPNHRSISLRVARFLERPWTSAWMREASGANLRHLADKRYGAWLDSVYHEVLVTHRPRLERVQATLRCPDAGPRCFDYDRLILPWTTPTGDQVATLFSVVRSTSVV